MYAISWTKYSSLNSVCPPVKSNAASVAFLSTKRSTAVDRTIHTPNMTVIKVPSLDSQSYIVLMRSVSIGLVSNRKLFMIRLFKVVQKL